MLSYKQRLKFPSKEIPLASNLFLASVADVQRFRRGAALIVRLAPYDYHRFHFPDRGKANTARYIKGRYHSVNPIALAKVPNLYCYNKRSVTEFSSEHFGRIAYVEVGAITIGSIVQTYNPGTVARGQEKGYFQYGGSTLVLLFEPGAIAFDRDLVQDSAHGLENHVLAGSKLGKKQS
ncbi:MAG: hypothetical protein HC770_02290 [Pseudanabaena sp. CRU_2_10]|nr:hypothetical protein [Pseudanabaena sp. CRU_2_10]